MGSEGLRGVAADKLGWEKLFSQKFERNCRPEICFAWKQDLCLQEVSKERRSSREKNLFGIYLPSRSEVTELGLGRQSQISKMNTELHSMSNSWGGSKVIIFRPGSYELDIGKVGNQKRIAYSTQAFISLCFLLNDCNKILINNSLDVFSLTLEVGMMMG